MSEINAFVNFNNMKFIWIIILGVVVIALAGGFYLYFTKENEPVFCTQEAKLCPDGSYVGRTGPRCEFAACSGEAINSGITGSVLLGPTCPVERIPPDPRCADKPFETAFAVTTLDGSRVIKELSSDSDGKFKVSIPSGNYIIKSTATKLMPRCADSGAIAVRTGAYTNVIIRCDTGIR